MKRLAVLRGIAILMLVIWQGLPSLAQAGREGKTPDAAPEKSSAVATVPAVTAEHPVPLKADTPASTCLECHGDLQKGKYVHSAMEIGCTACHNITNQNGATHVTLTAASNQLCLSCHTLSTDKVLHGPYREGLCVACHSPHSSNVPAHTWASAQDICLGCHTRERLKVDDAKKVVTTPWGQTLTLAEMKGWQYLNLDATLTHNHPVAGHPVSGANTSPKLAVVSCLSCHGQHASNFESLLPVGAPASMPDCRTCGVCKQCHENMY